MATKILVTGASGLMGRAMITELQKNGASVVGLSSAQVDLTDIGPTVEIFKQHQPEIVYHFAARVRGIMGNMREQGRSFLENIRINTNVIEAARVSGVQKIIAMGSTAIYSDVVELPMRETDIWIGPPHNSEFGYAHAKRSMLAQLECYRDQWGIDFAFCVSTNLFGPFDNFNENSGHVIPSLISKFFRAVRDNVPIYVWGTGTPQRDFLFVNDAAVAIRMVGEKFSGPINIASGRSITIKSLVEKIRSISNCSEKNIIWDNTKPDGQQLRKYDVSKLHTLGFQCRTEIEESLLETYRWYAENEQSARR